MLVIQANDIIPGQTCATVLDKSRLSGLPVKLNDAVEAEGYCRV